MVLVCYRLIRFSLYDIVCIGESDSNWHMSCLHDKLIVYYFTWYIYDNRKT